MVFLHYVFTSYCINSPIGAKVESSAIFKRITECQEYFCFLSILRPNYTLFKEVFCQKQFRHHCHFQAACYVTRRKNCYAQPGITFLPNVTGPVFLKWVVSSQQYVRKQCWIVRVSEGVFGQPVHVYYDPHAVKDAFMDWQYNLVQPPGRLVNPMIN